MSALAAPGDDVAAMMAEIGRKARAAAALLATAAASRKQAALDEAAAAIDRRRTEILAANAADLAAGRSPGPG